VDKHVMALLTLWDARRLRALAALEEHGMRAPAPARRVTPAAASTSGGGEASSSRTAAAAEAEAPAAAQVGGRAGGKQRAAVPPTVSHEERLQALGL
jgi:hypothetical protein